MIDHAFVINMPNSKERYRLFCENKTAIPIERLDGIDGTPYLQKGDPPLTRGIIGCMKASIRAIEIAKEKGYKTVLIFDDDAQLSDSFDADLAEAMSELPEDWLMLRLHITTTGNPGKEDYSKSLCRVYGGNGTYGYVLNSKYYDTVLAYLAANYRKPSTVDKGHIKTYDVILQELMEKLPFYETKKRLVYHRDGYSDRMGQVVNFGLGKPKTLNDKIKIYYPQHVQFHAQALSKTLDELGYENELVTEVDAADPSLHIIYCAFQIRNLPARYIAYQCEQWSSHWMTQDYWRIIRGSEAVWEWSADNVRKYPADIAGKVSFVPPGLISAPTSSHKDIDVLFYGAVQRNPHRQQVIQQLRRSFHLEVVDNLYGEAMLKTICRSKVVLNLHFYSKATLEMFRVNESLCCGAQVVSERVVGGHYPRQYHGLIEYGANISELKFAIAKALAVPRERDLSALDNRGYIEEAMSKVQNSKTAMTSQ